MTINAQLFAAAGHALFGEEWKRPLAALIGMNERTVFRIAKAAKDGEVYHIKETLAAELSNFLRQRARTATEQAQEAERLANILDGEDHGPVDAEREAYLAATRAAIDSYQRYADIQASGRRFNDDLEADIEARAREMHAKTRYAGGPSYDDLDETTKSSLRAMAQDNRDKDSDALIKGLMTPASD